MNAEGWARDTRAGIGWSVATFGAGRVLTFLATVILARLLVPAEFGVVAAILVYTSLLELASDLGMQATVVYEQERGRSERLNSAFTINLAIAIAFSAAGVLLAPLVASFFGSEGDVGLFRLAALSLLITGLGNIHDGLLLRELDFRRRVVPELTKGTVRGVVSVTLALAGAGAASLVFGLIAGQAAWVVVLWVITAYRPRLRFDREIARSMTAYGTGAVALEVLGVVATRADVVVIGKVLGVAALGIYTVAFRVPEVLIRSVTWSVSKVAFPALSRVRASDREALPTATLTLLRYQALGALPVAATLAVLSSPLIVVLFSQRWEQGAGVMAAIAVATGIGSLAYPLGDTFKAIGRQRTMVAINLVNLPLLVAGMIIVAPNGIVWVSWAVAVLATVNLIVIAALVSRALDIRPQRFIGAIEPAVATAAGCGLAAGVARVATSSEPRGVVLLGGVCAAAVGGALALRVLAPGTYTTVLDLARTVRPGATRRREARVATVPRPDRRIDVEPRRGALRSSLGGRWAWGGLATALLVPVLVMASSRSGTDGGDSSQQLPQAVFAGPAAPVVDVRAPEKAQETETALPQRHHGKRPRDKPLGDTRSRSGGSRQSVPNQSVPGGGAPPRTPRPNPAPAPSVSPAPTQPASPPSPSPTTQPTGKPVGSPGNGPVGAKGPDGTGAPGQLR